MRFADLGPPPGDGRKPLLIGETVLHSFDHDVQDGEVELDVVTHDVT